MYKKLFFIGLFTVLLQSCKPVVVDFKNSTLTQKSLSLLHIGNEEGLLSRSNYENNAITVTKVPIKVIISVNSFTKQTYKAFTRANKFKNKELYVKYEDSLENKPNFLSITIADKIAVLDAFKEKQNHSLREYLTLQPNARLITNISLVANPEDIRMIQHA